MDADADGGQAFADGGRDTPTAGDVAALACKGTLVLGGVLPTTIAGSTP